MVQLSIISFPPAAVTKTRGLGAPQTTCHSIIQGTHAGQPSDQTPASTAVDAAFVEPFSRVKPACTYRNCVDDDEPTLLEGITNALISQSQWCVCCSSALKAEDTEI